MSQIVSSLVAPPAVPSPRLGSRRRAVADAPTPGGSAPFSRARAQGPVAWIPGFAFGLVCLGAGLVFAVALVAVGVALAVSGAVARLARVVQARRPS